MRAPLFPGSCKKNDGVFMYGALQPHPFICTYGQNRVEVVFGPSCRQEQEIHLSRCAEDCVPVLERRGGGGTVVLAPGMIITICVGPRSANDTALEIFGRIHDSMIASFRRAGIDGIEKKGISDLAIRDRKILGSSLYMGSTPKLFYYQSSLLVSPDLSLLSRYLRHPPKEPQYRQNRTHDEFCTSLAAEGFIIPTEVLCSILYNGLQKMKN